MRGYGRDYENRGWFDRAGETVRGWFGGGRDYDRDYGPGDLRDWQHGTGWSGGTMDRHNMGGGMMNRGNMDRGMMDRGMMGGHRTNNWNNTRGYDATFRAGSGYYGADYDSAGTWGGNRGYDRDMDTGWQRGRPMRGGMMGGGMNRGQGMDRGSMDRGGMDRGGEWMGGEYGAGGQSAGDGWGDYNRGAWGGDLFRRSNAGGVEPGRHFRGYGHGSTGGNGYQPF